MARRDRASRRLDLALEEGRYVAGRAAGAVRSSPGLLFISLLLGFALWVSVSDIENPIRVDVFPAAVPVEAVNVDPSLAVANTLRTVEITVSAPENRWVDLTSDNFRAFVDLNGLSDREQMVPVEVDVQQIGGVRVTAVRPSTVLVNLEPLTTKEVPVEARLIGSVPLGFEVSSAEPAAQTVQVSGPSSLVALVERAVADVTVTGLTVRLAETAQLVPRGEGGSEIRGVMIDPPSMRVEVAVEQTTLSRQLPLHATFSGEAAAGYRVTDVSVDPASVTVEGPIDVLQSIDTIELAAVDISGATRTVTRRIAVEAPAGVGPLDVTATVRVEIEVITGTLRFLVPVRVQSRPDDVDLSLETPAVEVLLAGELPTLTALSAEDVLATIDLAGVTEGTTALPVDVRVPEGIRLVSVQPAEVSVTIAPPP